MTEPRDLMKRAALVGLAAALGWGIRGSFGSFQGAMMPGALAALGLLYVSGRKDWWPRAPYVLFCGIWFFAMGGEMSYGKVVGYCQAGTWIDATYGYAMLAVIGGFWGALGGGMIAWCLEPEFPRFRRWAIGIPLMLVGGRIAYYLVVTLAGVRMTPPRGDGWAYHLGMILTLVVLAWRWNYRTVLRGIVYGFVGYGLGFAIGGWQHMFATLQKGGYASWTTMEETVALLGGFALTYGVLSRAPSAAGTLELWWRRAGWLVIFVAGAWVAWSMYERAFVGSRLWWAAFRGERVDPELFVGNKVWLSWTSAAIALAVSLWLWFKAWYDSAQLGRAVAGWFITHVALYTFWVSIKQGFLSDSAYFPPGFHFVFIIEMIVCIYIASKWRPSPALAVDGPAIDSRERWMLPAIVVGIILLLGTASQIVNDDGIPGSHRRFSQTETPNVILADSK